MGVLRLALVLLGFVFAVPLAWQLTPRPHTRLEIALAGLGLSLGLLSLWMFYLGLLCAGCLRLGWIVGFEVILSAALTPSIYRLIARYLLRLLSPSPTMGEGEERGARGGEGQGERHSQSNTSSGENTASIVRHLANASKELPPPTYAILATLLLGGIALIFTHNAYYPFTDFDALARYAYEARLTFDARGLTPQVTGYPQLVQMNYAYAFLAFNSPVEWAALLTPSFMAAGAIGAVVALGRRWLNDTAGFSAGLLLLLTPIFARWSTSGYVDVPLSFMTLMAALALSHWHDQRTPARALWAGWWVGLALWTKQSALLYLGGAGLFVGLSLLADNGWRNRSGWLAIMRDGLLVLGVALLVAGPWYARNYLLDGPQGVIVSPPATTVERADPGLDNLIPFIAHPDSFGVGLSFVYAAGLLATLVVATNLLKRSRPERWAARLLLCLTLPHMLLWWQRYSYNPRHLIPMLPLAAVMGGFALALALEYLPAVRWRLPVAGALVLILGLLPFRSLETWGLRYYAFAPYHILLDPIGNVEARRLDALGDAYHMVQTIRAEVPPGADIITMDGRIAFYLSEYDVTGGYATQWQTLAQYDYLEATTQGLTVYPRVGSDSSPVLEALTNGDPRLELVAQHGDYSLYRINLDE